MVWFIQASIAVFFCAGALDYFGNNRFGLGNEFLQGIKTIGSLTLGMVGIYSLSPLIGDVLLRAFAPLSKAMGIEPLVFPSMFLAVDMGVYRMAQQVVPISASSRFASIIIGSTIGATISFSLPVALGMIKKEDLNCFLKSFVIGMFAIPPGCFAAGLMLGLDVWDLLRMLLPPVVLLLILALLLRAGEKYMLALFSVLHKVILFLALLGLAAQAIYTLTGYRIIEKMVPFEEAALLPVKIGIFLSGIYPLLYLLKKWLKKPLQRLGQRTGLDNTAMLCALGNLVTNIMIFDSFAAMGSKGKRLCAMLAVSAAFAIGGQLAYVSFVEPDMVPAFLLAKFFSMGVSLGIFAVQEKKALTIQL